MRKSLKVIGIIIGVVVFLLVAVAGYVQVRGIPSYEVHAPEVSVEADSASIARGEKLAGMVCFNCHRGEGGKLVGMEMWDAPPEFGRIYSPNITQHPEFGLGRYSDGELVYLLRTGIKRDGKYAPPWMAKFPLMSDEDMHAIIAYLRSDAYAVQADSTQQPPCQPSFLSKALCNFVMKPLPMPEAEIKTPPITDQVAHGKYLATAVLDCYSCHSESFMSTNILEPEKTPGYFGGGNVMREIDGTEVVTTNITMDETTGIGTWTEEQFFDAVRFGQNPRGGSLSAVMPKFSALNDEEVAAIWAYLQTVPKIANEVVRAEQGSGGGAD